ncbi:MAG: ribokinase [Armatimonadetes bacterium]|nr:ribokinase [Armatimonadota bacterium]MCX7969242.1 ribokinase [Armatimonadota bacterium]MDW8143193.1 ribokinase [Armatimonadota bacterium]
MSVKLVVVGSANMDMVAFAPKLPAPGETVLGTRFEMACGGKGANQAVACARLGADTWFVGRVGVDAFGDMLLRSFREAGVHTDFVRRDAETSSGVALIFVDEKGQNEIVVAPGANGRVSRDDIDNASAVWDNCKALLVQFEIPLSTVGYAIGEASRHGAIVVVNPAPAPREPLPEEWFGLVDVWTPNEREIEGLTGVAVTDMESAEKATKAMLDKGAKAVVLTLGANGSLVATPDFIRHFPAFPVQAVDATAAGDAFAAALTVRLAEGAPLEEAVIFANAAGALACTKVGAQPSMPKREEVEGFLQTQPLPI